ncbi:MAG: DUF3365 domain-containing protein [Acidobacteriota bacterium]
MRIFTGLMIVGCFVLIGCSGGQEQTVDVQETAAVAQWTTVTPEAMSETQEAQHELCLAATNAFASEMMGELMAALDSGDPTAGITVCGANAPAIAAHIAADYGVKIGRTSHKLRNPANTPPPWAEQVVADQVGQPTYLAGTNGEFGALLPIRLKAECQMCHGAPENIDVAIQDALAEHYPDDAATGFAEGDLRGWFWIEAPAGDTTS